MANEQKPPQRTASQRIDDLERAIMALYQTIDNVARDLMVAKDAIKLLGNKLESVAQLLSQNQAVSSDAISQQMVQNNIDELKEKVTNLVSQGVLKQDDTPSDNSFVVGREVDDDGKVVNPRLQFALSAIGEELRNKIKAAKLGDVVALQEGKLKFELLEVYSIQPPTSPEQQQVVQTATDAQSSGNEDQVETGESSGS